MNTGNALVMSPALITKYLDAGKDIASHAVLLPDGTALLVRDDPARLDGGNSYGDSRLLRDLH